MSPVIPKLVQFKFSGANENDPVTVYNSTKGEVVNTDQNDDLLRIAAKGVDRSVAVVLDNFSLGWEVGDVVYATVGGAKGGLATVTLTANTNAPQIGTVTVATASTAVLTI